MTNEREPSPSEDPSSQRVTKPTQPSHDAMINDAIRDRALSGAIIEAWKQSELRCFRPLPKHLERLKDSVTSGINLSKEAQGAFRYSSEYLGAAMTDENGIVRPEDSAGLSELQQLNAALNLANAEIAYHHRTSYLPMHRTGFVAFGAWMIGGATFDALVCTLRNSNACSAHLEGAVLFVIPFAMIAYRWLSLQLFRDLSRIKSRAAEKIYHQRVRECQVNTTKEG